jgi:hypothetical protein
MTKETFQPPAGFFVGMGEGAKVLLGGLAVHFKLRAGQTGGQIRSFTRAEGLPNSATPTYLSARRTAVGRARRVGCRRRPVLPALAPA